MKIRTFVLLLSSIVFVGLSLRVHRYEKAPNWNESLDEIHYAWTGLTWITEGVPRSWSWLSSYPRSETVNLWNTDFRLVSPMLEKPPLYSLLSGVNVLLFGQDELHEVKIATIRILPILLSIFTISLTGLLGAKVFSPTIGLLAALLYAITPPIVLANRLSLTENLMTSMFLTLQLLFIKLSSSFWQASPPVGGKRVQNQKQINFSVGRLWKSQSDEVLAIFIGTLLGLAALTKQSGLSAIFAIGGLFYYFKKWKLLIVSCSIALIIFSIHPIIGFSYDRQLFSAIQSELRRVGLQGGLPQLVQTIVSRPLITTEKLFPDGVMLLGYLLFFTSPWHVFYSSSNPDVTSGKSRSFLYKSSQPELPQDKQTRTQIIYDSSRLIFLSLPFSYLMYIMFIITGAEPIGSGQGYWGWYAFPLFPYLMILVAVILKNIWNDWNVFKGIIIGGIIGSSTIRYLLLFFPREWYYRWQHGLLGIIIFILISSLLKPEFRKRILIVFFILFVGISICTSFNVDRIY